MTDFVTIFYWIRLAALVLLVLLALTTAVRMSRRRRFGPVRDVSFALGAVAMFGGLVYVTGPAFSIVWAVALGVVGAALGFLSGRLSRFWTIDGRVFIRRAPPAPWLWALSAILLTMTLLFGSSYLFALAMLLQAFAMGVAVGQVAAEVSRRKTAGTGLDSTDAGSAGEAPAAPAAPAL
jgi:hypothetical protein